MFLLAAEVFLLKAKAFLQETEDFLLENATFRLVRKAYCIEFKASLPRLKVFLNEKNIKISLGQKTFSSRSQELDGCHEWL